MLFDLVPVVSTVKYLSAEDTEVGLNLIKSSSRAPVWLSPPVGTRSTSKPVPPDLVIATFCAAPLNEDVKWKVAMSPLMSTSIVPKTELSLIDCSSASHIVLFEPVNWIYLFEPPSAVPSSSAMKFIAPMVKLSPSATPD